MGVGVESDEKLVSYDLSENDRQCFCFCLEINFCHRGAPPDNTISSSPKIGLCYLCASNYLTPLKWAKDLAASQHF